MSRNSMYLVPFVHDKITGFNTRCPFSVLHSVVYHDGECTRTEGRATFVGSPECLACKHNIQRPQLSGNRVFCCYPLEALSIRQVPFNIREPRNQEIKEARKQVRKYYTIPAEDLK